MIIEITNVYGVIVMLILLMFIAPSKAKNLFKLEGVRSIIKRLSKLF